MKHRYHYIEVNPDGEVLKNFFFWVGARERRQIYKLNSRRSELVYICPSSSESLSLAYNAEVFGKVPMLCVEFSQLLSN